MGGERRDWRPGGHDRAGNLGAASCEGTDVQDRCGGQFSVPPLLLQPLCMSPYAITECSSAVRLSIPQIAELH